MSYYHVKKSNYIDLPSVPVTGRSLRACYTTTPFLTHLFILLHESENRTFLKGLKEYGRGDWKSISRKYVRSRSSTQVASHAQKYFQMLHKFAKQKESETPFEHKIKRSSNKYKWSSSIAFDNYFFLLG